MSRTKWSGLFAIMLICLLLVSPIQAAGSAPARPARGIVPLRADQQITRTIATSAGYVQTGQETHRLYRDSKGRTRYEAGAVITINDPATQTTLVLNTRDRTFRRVTQGQQQARPASVATNQRISSAPRTLGTGQISGVRAEGRAYTVTVPKLLAQGPQPLAKEVTLWLSTDVQLPVQVRVTDGQRGYEQTYTNIQAGTEPDARLFQIPAGYRDAQTVSDDARIQQACPVAYTDPVVLTSFGPFLGSGVATAVTDPSIGCFFAADAAIFEAPLYGGPLTPLGLPYDQWYVFDTGGPVPFLPWTAFGDIAFLATNFTDTTTVDSLIILTIF